MGQYFLFGTFFKKYRQKHSGTFNFKYRVPVGRAGFRQQEALGYLIEEALVSNDQTHLYAVAKREILKRGGGA